MVQINFAQKSVTVKIVYYGPGMSGKTTNLEIVHQRAPESNKGDLTSISTDGDRTLFFDFMPLDLGTVAGMRTQFQIYTVPGQVYYNSTRKLVLQGVDGVIFVADSSASMLEENLESLGNLAENLDEYGKDINSMPIVIQYNKRDLPDAMTVEELEGHLNKWGAPSFEAIANSGQGVFPTLKSLAARVLDSIHEQTGASGAQGVAVPSTPAAPAAPAAPAGAVPLSAPAAQPAPAAPFAQPAAPQPTAAQPPAPVSPPQPFAPAAQAPVAQTPVAPIPAAPQHAPAPAPAAPVSQTPIAPGPAPAAPMPVAPMPAEGAMPAPQQAPQTSLRMAAPSPPQQQQQQQPAPVAPQFAQPAAPMPPQAPPVPQAAPAPPVAPMAAPAAPAPRPAPAPPRRPAPQGSAPAPRAAAAPVGRLRPRAATPVASGGGGKGTMVTIIVVAVALAAGVGIGATVFNLI